jgi:O-antigen/teichoic acid export membrane protein
MLGFFKTTTDVGIYNAAIPTAKLILIIPTSLLAIYLPIITQVISDKIELKKIFYTTTKWILLANTLFLGAAILYGKNLLQILFGAEYIAGYTALSILIFSYYINGLSYTSRDILMVMKKTKTIFYATLTGGTINIILNYLLIPKYNLMGAAIATSISLIIISIIIYLSARISIINKNLIKVLIAGTIATIATYYITTNIYLGTIVITTLYIILLYLLKTFEKQDKDLINAIKSKLGLK